MLTILKSHHCSFPGGGEWLKPNVFRLIFLLECRYQKERSRCSEVHRLLTKNCLLTRRWSRNLIHGNCSRGCMKMKLCQNKLRKWRLMSDWARILILLQLFKLFYDFASLFVLAYLDCILQKVPKSIPMLLGLCNLHSLQYTCRHHAKIKFAKIIFILNRQILRRKDETCFDDQFKEGEQSYKILALLECSWFLSAKSNPVMGAQKSCEFNLNMIPHLLLILCVIILSSNETLRLRKYCLLNRLKNVQTTLLSQV